MPDFDLTSNKQAARFAFIEIEGNSNTTWTSSDGNNFQEEDPGGKVTTMLKVSALLWFLAIFVCIAYNRKKLRRSETQMEIPAELQENREARVNSNDPENRERLIKAAIISRKVLGYDEKFNLIMEGQDCTLSSKDEYEDRNSCSLEYQKRDGNDNTACVICLNRFEVGEELSWSQTLQCNHIFHSECVKPWFQKHSDCPCCRTKLILENSKGSNANHFNSEGNHQNNNTEESYSSSSTVLPEETGSFYISNGLVSRARRMSSLFQRTGSVKLENDTEEQSDSTTRTITDMEPSTSREETEEFDEEAGKSHNSCDT